MWRQADTRNKGSLYTGPVSFTIKMRNELQGTDTTMFTGKMKVAKAKTNEVGPKAAQKFVYFVDHDWNLPIGYVYLTASDVFGWKLPDFHVAFWVRGEATRFDPHLFYQGKEVGKVLKYGTEVGKPGCDIEVEINPTHYVEDSCLRRQNGRALNATSTTLKAATRQTTRRPLTCSRSRRIPASTRSRCCGTTSWRGRLSSPCSRVESLTTVLPRAIRSGAIA